MQLFKTDEDKNGTKKKRTIHTKNRMPHQILNLDKRRPFTTMKTGAGFDLG